MWISILVYSVLHWSSSLSCLLLLGPPPLLFFWSLPLSFIIHHFPLSLFYHIIIIFQHFEGINFGIDGMKGTEIGGFWWGERGGGRRGRRMMLARSRIRGHGSPSTRDRSFRVICSLRRWFGPSPNHFFPFLRICSFLSSVPFLFPLLYLQLSFFTSNCFFHFPKLWPIFFLLYRNVSDLDDWRRRKARGLFKIRNFVHYGITKCRKGSFGIWNLIPNQTH